MKKVTILILFSALTLSSSAFAESRKYNCTTIDRVFSSNDREVAVIVAGSISSGTQNNPLHIQAVIPAEIEGLSNSLKEAAATKAPISVSIERADEGFYKVTEAKKCVVLPGVPATEVQLSDDQVRELQAEIDRIARTK